MIEAAPGTPALRGAADAAYAQADKTGAVLPPAEIKNFVVKAAGMLQTEGLDKTLHPNATAVLRRFAEAADDPAGAPSIQTLRRLAGSAAGSMNPDEARLGKMLLGEFDDFIDNVAGQYGTELRDANKLWGRFRKAEAIDTALEEGAKAASGVENGVRIEFRKLLKNESFKRGLTADEIDAMEQVVKGSFTANTLKRLSRLSYGSGQQSGFLGGAIGSSAGAALGSAVGGVTGGGIGAVMAPAVGYAAQRGAEKVTLDNAMLARALMATGGARPGRPQSAGAGKVPGCRCRPSSGGRPRGS
jgi:hypothetical protein